MIIEAIAVALAALYLVLAIRQNPWCWAAAAISAVLYSYLCYQQALYMLAGLQVYYLAMAGYGAYQWRLGGEQGQGREVTTWPVMNHAIALGLIAVFTVLSSALLAQWTDASMPLLDSLTTWASVVTTFLVARKVLENWIYWFVIDAISVYLFAEQGMLATAGLYGFYVVMVIAGYISWRRDLKSREASAF